MSLISAEQVLAGAVDPLQVGDEVRRSALGVGLLLEHLAVADDRVQRRPQLVAHVGQELALRRLACSAGPLRPAARRSCRGTLGDVGERQHGRR